ncbi:MAG: SIS domain-containing protein [Deltaproteobacteria bacterium]|nr:SIS domain-containing protein [Deltaproteobacteria bacterium]
MSYVDTYMEQAAEICRTLDRGAVEDMIEAFVELRDRGGRLFILGVGGSAGSASHAVNDFRKIAKIETYTPVDNVSELTARTNDEGWPTVFAEWLTTSKIHADDAVLVFSVGGGDKERDISANIVHALDVATAVGAKVFGIVGRDGGYTARVADVCIVVPTMSPDTITPHTEAFAGVVWHLIVSDPRILRQSNKWESTAVNETGE